MQETQVLVKKEALAVYDKVSDKIFAGGLPKVTLLFGATPYANAGAALVHFPRGVRTAWHTHPAGQNLYWCSGQQKITWIKHLNKEKYEIDQKFIFDFGIFYLPMTVERTFAVK